MISHAEQLPEHFELQYKTDLEFLPEALDKAEFVSRDLLLHDLTLVANEVSERLNVSQARALALLSDPLVRWNHRAVCLLKLFSSIPCSLSCSI